MWSAFGRYGGLIAAAVARPHLADLSAALGILLALAAFALFTAMDCSVKALGTRYRAQMLFSTPRSGCCRWR